ncbi:MAG: putative PEP-binding protein [Pseudomonadota bacterium]
MPVPDTIALPFDTVRRLAAGDRIDSGALLQTFDGAPLLSVRPSAEVTDWGGPGTILNIGLTVDRVEALAEIIGEHAADELFLRFILSYAVEVARLDAEAFADDATAQAALATYECETDEAFPNDPATQLSDVLRSMARAWEGTSARLLRQAKGAPADAGLGLLVQRMVIGAGRGECGFGMIQFVDSQTGAPGITGHYVSNGQSRAALSEDGEVLFLQRDPQGPSLEDRCPDQFAALCALGARTRTSLREEMQIEFKLQDGALCILDAMRAPRSSRAQVRIAVDLAQDAVITKDEALLRIHPSALSELLHPQVAPDHKRSMIAHGIAASPGGATGRIVFSAAAAQALAAQGGDCILVRHETSSEDVRGMNAARGVLTERGGITSHAAVIARGLGVPCVVGAASELQIKPREKLLRTRSGQTFREGDVITLDGTAGVVLEGAARLVEPGQDEAFLTLMVWAEAVTDIGIRANADTPADAKTASRFNAGGIGLCRTEHMFFEHDRLTVMREMIFADSAEDRQAALDRLLPMQRADFLELFRTMKGLPVCIRLLDPPLHEFLPQGRAGVRELADAMDLPLSEVSARVKGLAEFNPMLGMRGVRLGITIPEIYDMQARAIFEATAQAARQGIVTAPEIMIPLVSAKREVELVKARIAAAAAQVRVQTGVEFDYELGVIVETPRAALRAGEIADHVAFLSFGTNDLTQMVYGLSRDDAGRFMSTYVQQGVYLEDPFLRMDTEGVGELLILGAERGRAARSDLILSICGEHGGNADSIAFCRKAGFNYVSCSPFRVPEARLAAAQLAISDRRSARRTSSSDEAKNVP